jgi:hypothetical protein
MVRPLKISKKNVKALVQSSDWHLDADMTARASAVVPGNVIYSCLDGRVLKVLVDEVGQLFNNKEDWATDMAEIEAIAAAPSMSHVLDGKLPHKQGLAEASGELAQRLYGQLNLNSTLLDGSLESLKNVDRAIKKVDQSECLSPQIFEPLLAYIGEVVKSIDPTTHWEMRKLDNPPGEETWEPWLVVSQQKFPIFIWLYDELYEHRKASTHSLALRFSAY